MMMYDGGDGVGGERSEESESREQMAASGIKDQRHVIVDFILTPKTPSILGSRPIFVLHVSTT